MIWSGSRQSWRPADWPVRLVGPGTDTIAAGALLDVLDHFRHDAIQAHWVTLEISGPTTTP